MRKDSLSEEQKGFFEEAVHKLGNRRCVGHLAVACECLGFFMEDAVSLVDIDMVNSFQTECFACQSVHGDTDIFFGISGSERAITYFAGRMTDEEYDGIDTDVYDALCEFTNLVNGRYITYVGNEDEDIQMDSLPPMCCENCNIRVNGSFCVLTVNIGGEELKLISVVDVIPYMS